MSDLTKNEEIMLLTVFRLEENAYGVTIKNRINELTGKNWNYGTLYCTLDQLVKKGFLNKSEGEPLPERGGRRKIFYTLTPYGAKALEAAHTLQRQLWEGVNTIALKDLQ